MNILIKAIPYLTNLEHRYFYSLTESKVSTGTISIDSFKNLYNLQCFQEKTEMGAFFLSLFCSEPHVTFFIFVPSANGTDIWRPKHVWLVGWRCTSYLNAFLFKSLSHMCLWVPFWWINFGTIRLQTLNSCTELC